MYYEPSCKSIKTKTIEPLPCAPRRAPATPLPVLAVAPAPAPTPQSVARRPPRRGRVLTFSHMDRSDDRPLPHNQPQTCHVTLTGRLDGTLSTGRFQFHVAAQA